MPTGAGKSVCYQIPAIMSPGVAFVVSPLIALMNNQVTALQNSGYPAESVNSFKSESENIETLNRASKGQTKLIYISPERLLTELERMPPDFPLSFMAIDEAHCISQWGHDFRPDYTNLSKIRDKFPKLPIIALTATADALTRDDIVSQLRLRDPYIYISSFDRPNISLSILPSPAKQQKLQIIRELARQYVNDSGIVYCMTRKTTEDVAASLNTIGLKVVCYHAGLSAEKRNKAQEDFINGNVNVIVATVAFGMGIDKSNIRWIVHYNLPGNIESYYQEIGRAGRDGMPAEAILFYNYQDVIMRESLIAESDRYDVFHAKLNQMKQYAESRICRRRVLLSYFNEETTKDCGNCDVCKNPPVFFNGNIPSQKVMSAIARAGGKLSANTVIDILRGNNTRQVLLHNYHQMPTFGVGREYSPFVWRSLIGQMIQLGLLETHIDDYGRLTITPYGRRVLKGQESINLVLPEEQRFSRKYRTSTKAANSSIEVTQEEALLEQLKSVRRNIATKQHIPDYVICSDASLSDMVARHPLSIEAFSEVSGIGEIKAVKYWRKFVSAIRKFDGLTDSMRGSSLRETLILHNAGYSPLEIAKIKGVTQSTIYGHFAELINNGLITTFDRIISPAQLASYIENRDKEKWFDIVNDILPDGMWRVAKAIAEMQG